MCFPCFHFYPRAYDPKRIVGRSIFQSWDTASSSREFGDYSVGTTWYVDNGKYYLLDVRRKQLLYPDLKKEIFAYSREYSCLKVVIEEMGAGRHLIQEFRAMEVPIISYMPKVDKVMRLAAVSPLIEAGVVLFPDSAPWLDDLIMELLQFPNGSHDDQVDSLSQFLNYMEERKIPDMAIYDFHGNIRRRSPDDYR